jgi:fumarate hydratase class II
MPARLAELVERSLMLVTALAPHIGVDTQGCHGRWADEFDRWVKPAERVRGRGGR